MLRTHYFSPTKIVSDLVGKAINSQHGLGPHPPPIPGILIAGPRALLPPNPLILVPGRGYGLL